MQLQTLDWIVIVVTLAICFAPSLFFARRAGRNTSEFFASGRSVPWWLAGLSMVATTFSSDTPNLVTDIVRKDGVAGNWVWWAFTLTGLATVFFYARLWRRSGVLTDLEFYELRYSGKPASAVRGFRAIYLGVLFNCLVLASVNLAICKIMNILFNVDYAHTLLVCGIITVFFAAHAGLWGVLVIDMVQFFVMMTAVLAAAYFAVDQVGGLEPLISALSAPRVSPGGHTINYLNVLPDFTNNWDLAVAVLIIPITVQWWAAWYPGAEPGGGSYIAQRMLASKSEKDALGAVLFFNLAHYVLRPWPWILVALASLIVYPTLDDIRTAFPLMDESMLDHDIAYPAMLVFMPAGFFGLIVAGLVAAYSSTVLTHLNWGASYVVHDFYRRFIKGDADEKHYVLAGRIATVAIFIVACGITLTLGSAKQAFTIIIQVGAGTGLLYLLRWFWWRINAWCEIVAMAVSFVVSMTFMVLHNAGYAWNSNYDFFATVIVTTICWVVTAYIAPQTDRATLIDFYRRVRPFGPGWRRIRIEAGISESEARVDGENIPLALLGWFTGTATVWSALFMVGNFLYGRTSTALVLSALFVVAGSTLIWTVNRLWSGQKA